MSDKLALLETELRNPRTMDLDQLPTAELVKRMHAENIAAFTAVEKVLPQVTQVVDIVVERLGRGGRLFYVGAGTSGRMGVLDASECPPTFGVSKDLIQGLIAGGDTALRNSIEGAEDDTDLGARDLAARDITCKDVVIGIAASGRTPYVIGALYAARAAGAFPVAIANVSHSLLASHADITIEAVTGPEVVTGSTRLKAGTAQKLILNLITTAAMVRLGKVYSNLMVDVRASNVKLRDRAVRILMSATDVDRPVAEAALEAAEGQVKTAIVMILREVSAAEADRLLAASEGWVGKALV